MPSVPSGSSARQLTVILLLALGVVCWVSLGVSIDRRSIHVAAAILLALLIPPIRRRAAAVLDRARQPSPRSANWTAVVVSMASVVLLYAFAIHQDRPFVPTFHDEHSYLIQMQMLARGRLWMPQHPLADFFETFYILVKPVYAGIYFPGTSLFYVPTVWLHLPYWSMPLLVAGSVVGMTYRVLTELVDGVAGLLGGLLVLSLQPFRLLSIMMMSHPLMMLWGLLTIWTWLRWRRQQARGWALALGGVLGWAAITRPLDALCFAAPIAVGIVWDLRGKPIADRLTTVGLIAAAAIPFLSIQGIANYGITGHLLETPAQEYVAQTYGGASLLVPSVLRKPQSKLLQMQMYHEYYIAPPLRGQVLGSILSMPYKSRLPEMVGANVSNTFLLMLAPAGLLGLTDVRRRLAWSVLPIFLGAYVVVSSLLPHYALPVAPLLALTVIMGIQAVAETWPGRQRAINTILTLVMASFAITAMPGVKAVVFDPGFFWPVMTVVHRWLPRQVRAPAVVLFPFHPGDNFHEEPVYNVDVAWPDDAPIIHVQDLGPERDQELAAYYARTQPDRNFYLFDRRDFSIRSLGKPAEFLASLRRTLAAAPSQVPSEPAAKRP